MGDRQGQTDRAPGRSPSQSPADSATPTHSLAPQSVTLPLLLSSEVAGRIQRSPPSLSPTALATCPPPHAPQVLKRSQEMHVKGRPPAATRRQPVSLTHGKLPLTWGKVRPRAEESRCWPAWPLSLWGRCTQRPDSKRSRRLLQEARASAPTSSRPLCPPRSAPTATGSAREPSEGAAGLVQGSGRVPGWGRFLGPSVGAGGPWK